MQEQSTSDAVREIQTYNDQLNYFNVEVSRCASTLAINASKKGIDTFLNTYGHLPIPPKVIAFKEMSRSQRKWASWDIRDNKKAVPTDPTPYMAYPNSSFNQLVDELHFNVIEQAEDTLFAAGIHNGIVLFYLNEKGWKQFLSMLRCLRDQTYWFYVTIPHNDSWKHLPFQLSASYPGTSDDKIFKAIEYIRLEPDNEAYLSTSLSLEEIERARVNNCCEDQNYFFGVTVTITGNSTGLLLFSKWMHEFALSPAQSHIILNQWETILESLTKKPQIKQPFNRIHLQKIEMNSSYSIFSFEGKDDGSEELYIFGNDKGFEELSQVIEEYAFNFDHEYFFERPSNKRLRGDSTEGLWGKQGTLSLMGWELLGGGLFTPKYYPLRFNYDRKSIEIEENFINDRIVLNYAKH